MFTRLPSETRMEENPSLKVTLTKNKSSDSFYETTGNG